MVKIKSFLLLPMANQQDIDNFVNFRTVYQRLKEMVEVLECEKEVDLFYDKDNVRDFEELLRELQGEHRSPQLVFASLLSNARDINGVNVHDSYLAWNFPGENTVLNHKTKLLIKMVEEILLSASHDTKTPQKFLLLNFTDFNPTGTFLPIIKDCGKETCPQLVCLPQVTETEKLELWLRDHRQPRVFNKNPKHGEQGKGVKANKGETVSRLLCGPQEAQALLDTAIGCAAETKELYNFDRQHNQYLVFKDENTPNNSYHGYHIEINNSGEIPAAIRTRLGVAV